ncbi:MAG: BLUF domain-containing protein [Lewinellaceae bacterium]|nr:BLUF domain-containing protein [Lewinellaceae bacterium]
MPVFQLIYRSRANRYFTDDDLIELLKQCRSNNAEQNITGLLLYGHGSFIQLLEGDEAAVRDLYHHRISQDARHRELAVLHRTFAPKRLFKDWSMAFRPMDATRIRSVSGYTDPAQPAQKNRDLLAPLRLLELMQGFAADMRKR